MGYSPSGGHRLEVPDEIVGRVQAMDRVEQTTGEVAQAGQLESAPVAGDPLDGGPFIFVPGEPDRFLAPVQTTYRKAVQRDGAA